MSNLFYYPVTELHFYIRFMQNCQALPILLGHYGISVFNGISWPWWYFVYVPALCILDADECFPSLSKPLGLIKHGIECVYLKHNVRKFESIS